MPRVDGILVRVVRALRCPVPLAAPEAVGVRVVRPGDVTRGECLATLIWLQVAGEWGTGRPARDATGPAAGELGHPAGAEDPPGLPVAGERHGPAPEDGLLTIWREEWHEDAICLVGGLREQVIECEPAVRRELGSDAGRVARAEADPQRLGSIHDGSPARGVGVA